MITIFAHGDGRTTQADRIDPTWLAGPAGPPVWVDLAAPTHDEARVLTEVFHFHELAVEDALSQIHHPKAETYDSYLYVILHSIDFQASRHRFATHDVDFFLGPNYLVTVHGGTSRSIALLRDLCPRSSHILGEGPAALMHRLVDAMLDSYEPEVERIDDRLDKLEKKVIEQPNEELVRAILALKRDVLALRRVTLPQRDVVNRLARREFSQINEAISYRFRDVYDHLVRLVDQAASFQDRVTGILDAYLSSVSNRLNQVMKVLTVIATIFMPLTVLASLYGMNVALPEFPGGPASQFWWVLGIMVATSAVMLWYFKRKAWL